MTHHVDGVFAGSAGGEIYWQSWLPDAAMGVVVIAHGLAEHSGRYGHVGHRLAAANLAVYALDHHGHGKSGGTRANVNRMAHVRADLNEVIGRAAARHPGVPLFLFGHSLGGLIALDYVTTEDSSKLSGLLLSGAAVDPSVGTPVQRLAAKVLSSLTPNLGVMALDSTAVSRDPAEVTKYQTDSLNYRGKVRARTGAEAFAAVERITARLGSVRLPILIMHGTADRLASSDGSRLVADRVCSRDVTLKLYDGLYHEILNEPERDEVLNDIADWLGEKVRGMTAVIEQATVPSLVARQASLAGERAEPYKTPRLVAGEIGSSARFRAGVATLAKQLGRTEASVTQEATDKLSTFVATQSRVMGDLFNEIFRRMHERAWKVSVDLDTLERLRALNKSHALVFLPSHRTYMDPRVLASVLREHNFSPNYTLGGNNMSFWPVGAVGRRAGYIWIRRKFGDDPVYRFAMRSYLAHLVEKRFNLEWYPEGGRSRTGKLRQPMLGLLSYVADAVEQLPDADAMVVPVSIVYDQLPEIAAMAAESAGGTKKAETLKWLLQYARAQQTDSGTARVRFGEPFSLRSALADAGEGRTRLEKVAFQVMDGINAATPISATSLASFALLGADECAFTRSEIETVLAPLLGYIHQRELPGPDPALCHGLGLERTLDELTRAGVLSRYDGGSEPVWWITPGNHAVAAYYRNGAIHHLVNRAIVELALLGVADRPAGLQDVLAAARDEALKIRDLLKFEFFFRPKAAFLAQLRDELDLLAPGWQRRSPSTHCPAQVLRDNAGALVASRTLQPFLDAQLVVAEQLVALGEQWIDRDQFVARCLGVGGQMLLQRKVKAADSVSRELYTAAVKLADNRGLLESGTPGLAGRRAELLAEIAEMRSRLATIAQFETVVAQ